MPTTKWLLPLSLIAVGLVLKFGGPLTYVCDLTPQFRDPVCLIPCIIGNILYLTGCTFAAHAKGRSLVWGMSGLLCVLALPILYFLPDLSPCVSSRPVGFGVREQPGC